MKEWMKSKLGILAIAVLMISSIGVIAGVGTVVSPVKEITNTVEGMPVELSLENISTIGLGGESEKTNWTPGVLHQSVEYDLGVNVTSYADFETIYLYISISGVGISESDVSLMWYKEATDAWHSISFNDEGDSLTGVFGPSTGYSVPQGYQEIIPLIVEFNTEGDYITHFWVEAI
jgi:hypothetical protein